MVLGAWPVRYALRLVVSVCGRAACCMGGRVLSSLNARPLPDDAAAGRVRMSTDAKLPHDKTLEKIDTLGAERRGVRANTAESACVLSSCANS